MPSIPFSRSFSLRHGSTTSDLRRQFSKLTRSQLKADITRLGGDIRGLNSKPALVEELSRLFTARSTENELDSEVEQVAETSEAEEDEVMDVGMEEPISPTQTIVQTPRKSGFEMLNAESPNMGQGRRPLDNPDLDSGANIANGEDVAASNSPVVEGEGEEILLVPHTHDPLSGVCLPTPPVRWESTAEKRMRPLLFVPIAISAILVLFLAIFGPDTAALKTPWLIDSILPNHVTTNSALVLDNGAAAPSISEATWAKMAEHGCQRPGRAYLGARKPSKKDRGAWIDGVLFCPGYAKGNALSAGQLARQGFSVQRGEKGGYKIIGSEGREVGTARLENDNSHVLRTWARVREEAVRSEGVVGKVRRVWAWFWST